MAEDERLPPGAAATLEALLTGPDPVRAALRAQIPYARVTGHCGCGCATVNLRVDRTSAGPAPPHENPAVSASYTALAAPGVLVFTDQGYLSGLEIYSVADEPVTVWPEPRLLSVDDDM